MMRWLRERREQRRIKKLAPALGAENWTLAHALLDRNLHPDGPYAYRNPRSTTLPDATPLSLAAYYCQPALVDRLLAMGATVDLKVYNGFGGFGRTGLNLTLQPQWVTPLCIALDRWSWCSFQMESGNEWSVRISEDCAACIRYLVRSGARVEDESVSGALTLLPATQLQQLEAWQAERVQCHLEKATADSSRPASRPNRL